MGSAISPEEFRKLQIQVDILQRFLTKTFGSSFLEFCKSAQQALLLQEKSPSAIGKTQQPVTNGSHTSVKAETSVATKSNAARRPPPPLLHRPGATTGNEVGTAGGDVKIVADNTELQGMYNSAENDNGEEEEIYFEEEVEEEEEEEVDLLQPETVFSDDDANVSHKQSNSRAYNQNGAKRGHSEAFGYDESEYVGQAGVNLPEGTDCIVIDSDEDQDQGQLENFVYQEDDESYADGNNDEMYEEGYGYDENGMQLQTTESYRTEDVQTDGNVTFGTLVTAPDTGMQYFQCAFCPSPKVFKHKQSLKEHYLLNHSPTPPAFQCQCGRRFLKLSQLKRHEVVHTAERPFVCPICHKDFTRKDNMTVHMVRNHAEKKEKCPICPDKFYATTAEVNRHVRLYHSQWKQQ